MNEINNIWSSPFPNSIGLFYSAITDYLGFSINEGEYKVMGLAAYGEPKFYETLSETIFLGFLLGISLDLISQSAGAHTIACLTIGFLRPYFAMILLLFF